MTFENEKSITEIICDRIGIPNILEEQLQKKMEKFEEVLLERNIKIFLVLDEFESVFSGHEIGKTIVRELHQICDSNSGIIHCIVTGSSILQLLCFGNLPEDKKNLYPNYQGFDLNNTKLQPIWIYSFNQLENIINF